MQNLAKTAPGTAEVGGKKSLKERAVSELEKYAVVRFMSSRKRFGPGSKASRYWMTLPKTSASF